LGVALTAGGAGGLYDDEAMKTEPTRLPAVVILVMTFGVVPLLVWGLWKTSEQAALAQRSLTWPSVHGTIISTRYDPPSGGYRTYRGCRLHVHYRFEVDAESRAGDRFSYGSTSCDDLREAAWLHPAGSDVLVYYDPSDHTRSLLSPRDGRAWPFYLLFVPLIVVLLFAGGLVLVLELRLWRPPSRADQRRRERARQRRRPR
jgi:hypothetical protein